MSKSDTDTNENVTYTYRKTHFFICESNIGFKKNGQQIKFHASSVGCLLSYYFKIMLFRTYVNFTI